MAESRALRGGRWRVGRLLLCVVCAVCAIISAVYFYKWGQYMYHRESPLLLCLLRLEGGVSASLERFFGIRRLGAPDAMQR